MVMVGNPPQTSRTSTAGNAEGKTGTLALDDLGVLTFDGPDSASFLQGYLTIDLDALGSEPAFTAMCNIKGRTVLTGYAWREGERVTLIVHQSLCALALSFLAPYLAFSKTQASDATAHCTLIGALGLNLPVPAHILDAERQIMVLHGEDINQAQGLLAAGPTLDASDWRNTTIAKREVWLETATSGFFLPQMLALDEIGAVSFTKGCYLGQEIVARAQHRGEVKRKLTTLAWSGEEPHIGAELRGINGHAAGVVVASAAASANEGAALAVMGRHAIEPFTIKSSASVLRTTEAS
ncbi:MAG: hypothetical protein F4X81_16770 [Gammaproteobacteria bacterium]|nr:hypothetical protein [Gammaproteobacteria bacterium]